MPAAKAVMHGAVSIVNAIATGKGLSHAGELAQRCACNRSKEPLDCRTNHFPAVELPCERFCENAHLLVKILKHDIHPSLDEGARNRCPF